MGKLLCWTLAGAFCVSAWAADESADERLAALTEEDLAEGKVLYQTHCALCHGIEGTGGRGPRLDRAKLKRASNSQALFDAIRAGIAGTEMPAVWWVNDEHKWRIAGYVRSLGRVAEVPLPGDSRNGKTLFETNDCMACHIVNGAGSSLGPELTEIGARRNIEYLRESLINPAAAAPDDFLMVLAITRQGEAVEGMRLNEDSFTIQLRDANNVLYSFRKADLRSLRKQARKSPMPSYRDQLDPKAIDDLVSYLATLRGEL